MIVGVTVGCTIAALVITGTGVWFFLRRHQLRRQQDTAKDRYDITPWTPDAPDYTAAEYPGRHPGPYTIRYSGNPEI